MRKTRVLVAAESNGVLVCCPILAATAAVVAGAENLLTEVVRQPWKTLWSHV